MELELSEDRASSKPKKLATVNTYRMRPQLQESFKTNAVNDIMQKVISEKLQGKTYNSEQAGKWTKEIVDEIGANISSVAMPRYKHVVQVILGQQTGAGCRYIAKCCWDAESDSQTSYTFTNASLFCVCTVFGVYQY